MELELRLASWPLHLLILSGEVLLPCLVQGVAPQIRAGGKWLSHWQVLILT